MRLEKEDKMLKEVGVALIQKPLDEGITKQEACDLFDMLSGAEAIPFDVQGEGACAMGFINRYDPELIDYAHDKDLADAIKEVLDDTENESETGFYVFKTPRVDMTIYIGYAK